MNELDSLRAQLESLNLRVNGKHSALLVRDSFQTQKEVLFDAVPQHQAQNIGFCSLQKIKDLSYSPEHYPEKKKIHKEWNLSHCLLKNDEPLGITSAGEDKSQHN